MPDLPETEGLANLGWLNTPSQELCAAMDTCDKLGHKRTESWNGDTASRYNVTCTSTCVECGFFYKVNL